MKNEGTIIYIGGFELPDKNAAAHRVLSNGKGFKDIGFKVVFIGVNKNISVSEPQKKVIDSKFNIQGFDCYSIKYPTTKKDWYKYLTDITYIKEVCSEYNDIRAIIAYNFASVALKKLIQYCKNKNFCLIGDCTEWYSAKGKGLKYFAIKSLDTFFRMRILHKKLNGLIVISDYLKNYYKKCKNVYFIPPLVDLCEKKWKKKCKKKCEDIKKLKFVYAGSPGRKDNIKYLIHLVKTVNIPYELYIIGIKKEDFIFGKDNEFLTLDVDSNIKILGQLSHLETIEYIKSSDYTIFFRDAHRVTKAGFPTKFVEGVSSGTTVITNWNFQQSYDYKIVSLKELKTNNKRLYVVKLKKDTFNYVQYDDIFKKIAALFLKQ